MIVDDSSGGQRNIIVVLTALVHGGAETQVLELLKQLKGTSMAPRVVVSLSGELFPYGPVIETEGYPVIALQRRTHFDVSRVFALRKLLKTRDAHLVHAVGLLASVYCWLAAKWLPNCVVLPTIQGTIVEPGRLRRFLYRRMFAECPRTLANSAAGAAFASSRLGAMPDRLVVLTNGIDFEALRRSAQPGHLRTELGLDRTLPLVGFVGRDAPVKQVPRFLQVVETLLTRVPNLHAVIVGPGLDSSARTRLAPRLPESQVHFLGPRFDVPRLLADMDVLFLTSDSEGTPNVVLEALGAGTPVIAADVGDVADILRDSSLGTVIERTAIHSYVAATLPYLQDRETARERVKQHWPELERRYGTRRMVRDTQRLWATLIDQLPPASRRSEFG